MATKRFEPLVQLDNGINLPAAAGTGKVLTSDSSGNGTWQTPLSSYHPELQNGVVLSTDLALSSISINTGTGALTFTPAATGVNPAWVNTSGGVLTAVAYGGAAVTPTASAPATTKYAVVGVEIDTTGVITIIKGTDTATQLNTASLIITNSPATSSGKMRIADFAVWNNAGTYNFSDHTTVATQGTNWVDRRPWARGEANTSILNADQSTSSSTMTAYDTAHSQMRIECTGVELEFNLAVGFAYNTTAGATFGVSFDLGVDGSAVGAKRETVGGGSNEVTPCFTWRYTPTAGSHLFVPMFAIVNTPSTARVYTDTTNYKGSFSVRGHVRQNSNNGTS